MITFVWHFIQYPLNTLVAFIAGALVGWGTVKAFVTKEVSKV
jgi:hypothetical protein